jgi:methyl-accepting chemotaxis protein
MTDRKGIITYVNDLFCEVAGYTREECIGQNQNMVRHPNMPKAVFKDLWATIGSGKVWRGDVENMCKDGSSYHVDALISPIIGSDGKPEGYLGIRYEKTLQVLESVRAQSYIDAIDTSFASIEFDPSGTILSANSNFIKTLGYAEESDIKGQHHRMFCEDSYTKTSNYIEFWKSLANGEAQNGQFKRITKQREDVWIQAAYTPIKDEEGNVVKVIKIATDITEDVIAKLNAQGIRDTVNSSFAYIEFDPSGIVQMANENFVQA